MTLTATYDPTLFQGAASYYGRYRTRYPQELFDHLATRFDLDGTGRLLDLGCGAGLIAIPFRQRFAEVIAVDPDSDMLREAKAESASVGADNITWRCDRAESITSGWGQFHLVTLGRSFHWMQRIQVLDKLRPQLTPGAGVAIIKTNEDPWHSEHPWRQAAIAVVKRWLGERRRTGQSGQGFWQPLAISHEAILSTAEFTHQELLTVPFERRWTVDDYLGYLYSTAFALPSFFGGDRPSFEQELRAALLGVEPSGQFTETLTATALLAWPQG